MELKDNCGICRVSLSRNAVLRLLPCQHILHQKCYQTLQDNMPDITCPICRSEIREELLIERKHYSKHTTKDRERIVTCANRGEDWISLAKTLNVNYKTAYHWVQSGRAEMQDKGGVKPKALSDAQTDILAGWVEQDCSISLKQLREKVRNEFHKVLAISTIGNYLEGRLYTMKKVHHEPISMNNLENKRKRAEYVQALNNYIAQGKQIVWIDETNFNLFCRQSKGRALAGSRAVQLLPASRGPNVHLIGAISAAGVVSIERRRGSFTARLAQNWIARLLEQWQELGNQLVDLVIVADNAPCHSAIETAVNGTPATILRLGPYSPMLNPIETIWSKIKAFVKEHLRVPVVAAPGVVEQRLVYLEQIIDQAKDTIVGGDCARAAQHSTVHHATALAMQDMPVGR